MTVWGRRLFRSHSQNLLCFGVWNQANSWKNLWEKVCRPLRYMSWYEALYKAPFPSDHGCSGTQQDTPGAPRCGLLSMLLLLSPHSGGPLLPCPPPPGRETPPEHC